MNPIHGIICEPIDISMPEKEPSSNTANKYGKNFFIMLFYSTYKAVINKKLPYQGSSSSS